VISKSYHDWSVSSSPSHLRACKLSCDASSATFLILAPLTTTGIDLVSSSLLRRANSEIAASSANEKLRMRRCFMFVTASGLVTRQR
jgi:hypothetical protein